MLSLSPRFDLFDFSIPKTFFPQELIDKYNDIISKKQPAVFTNIVDYANESIIGLTLPGLSEMTVTQPQISFNPGLKTANHINTEPNHDNKYLSPENPLSKIDAQLTVTFRQNQGLLNYFLLYETAFHRYCRPWLYDSNDVFKIYLKDESGKYIANIPLYQPQINSIDGLEFSKNKMERGAETFNTVFDFNNIDFEYVEG